MITRGQVFFLNGKDRSGFYLDIAYGALAPGDVGEFGVVLSGRYADNTQAFIRRRCRPCRSCTGPRPNSMCPLGLIGARKLYSLSDSRNASDGSGFQLPAPAK